MTPTRREFIRNVGIAMASLAMARCIPFRGRGGSPRDRLRDCWLRLEWLVQQAEGNYERGERARDDLAADHRTALDDLIAAGDLDAQVADSVEMAFDAASIHIVRVSAPVICYEPVEVDYTPPSSDQLARQAELLTEIGESGDQDPDAVAQARAAIERDIAFLSLSHEETQALYDELRKAAVDGYGFPSFDELDLDIPPEAAAAARFLADLLLGEAE